MKIVYPQQKWCWWNGRGEDLSIGLSTCISVSFEIKVDRSSCSIGDSVWENRRRLDAAEIRQIVRTNQLYSWSSSFRGHLPPCFVVVVKGVLDMTACHCYPERSWTIKLNGYRQRRQWSGRQLDEGYARVVCSTKMSTWWNLALILSTSTPYQSTIMISIKQAFLLGMPH